MPDNLEEIPTADHGAPSPPETKAEALQLSVRLELTPISTKYKLLMAKKARKDNKKEKNVKQVMKAEEVAGYRGNEDTDAILMGLGESPSDITKGKNKAKKPFAEKKGRYSINEIKDETTPLKDEEDVLKDDFSKFVDHFRDKLHADYVTMLSNLSIQIFAGPEHEPVNPEELKKIQIELIRKNIPDDKISTAVIIREIQNPDDFQIYRKKVEGSRPIFDREELKEGAKIKSPKRVRAKYLKKKVARKFQKRQKYRRQAADKFFMYACALKSDGGFVCGASCTFCAWRAAPKPFRSQQHIMEEENRSAFEDCEDEGLRDKINNLKTSGRKRPGMRWKGPGSGKRIRPDSNSREMWYGKKEASPCSCADKDYQSRNDQLQIELPETTNRLRAELSLERKSNEQLQAKLIHNEFFKYSEILGQRQKDNQNFILHIRESPGLKLIPQVQDALIALDEFSARLVLASEELNSQYKTMVQQSPANKVKDINDNELHLNIKELCFDLTCLEPPNLGTTFLNFLQSFIIMGQSSLHPTSTLQPPPAIMTYPPPLKYRPPSSIHSDQDPTTLCPKEVIAPTSPIRPLDQKMTETLPGMPISPLSTTSLRDPAQSAMSYLSWNSTSQNATGTRPKVLETGTFAASVNPITRTKKRFNNLIAQLNEYHPSLSLADAHSYVMELRKSNNGKLSGMSIQDIIKKVTSFIERDKGVSCGVSARDENCSICFDDMSAADSTSLSPCHHRFHINCINIWLESPGGAGSTCPMCRNYIVKEEEFPGLGSSRKF